MLTELRKDVLQSMLSLITRLFSPKFISAYAVLMIGKWIQGANRVNRLTGEHGSVWTVLEVQTEFFGLENAQTITKPNVVKTNPNKTDS